MRKRERLIKEHLESMERLRKSLPEKYHPYLDVTTISYGIFKRKTITAEEIKNYGISR